MHFWCSTQMDKIAGRCFQFFFSKGRKETSDKLCFHTFSFVCLDDQQLAEHWSISFVHHDCIYIYAWIWIRTSAAVALILLHYYHHYHNEALAMRWSGVCMHFWFIHMMIMTTINIIVNVLAMLCIENCILCRHIVTIIIHRHCQWWQSSCICAFRNNRRRGWYHRTMQ